MSHAEKCPVCNGNGQVSPGFYDHDGTMDSWVSYGTACETCRSCQGKGWIEVKEK